MTETTLVAALIALTLAVLTFILGGQALLALAVLGAGFATAFGLVCLLCCLPPSPFGGPRRGPA